MVSISDAVVEQFCRTKQGSFNAEDKELHYVGMDSESFGTPQFQYNWNKWKMVCFLS